ncbi:hypothetical protein ACIGN6_00410 [Streptomyces sp. NPDC053792]|uniref:hypothetical protein n=1 Tax=unclassified Streptomyces TaxID=2593676 RepID=UPI003415C0A1
MERWRRQWRERGEAGVLSMAARRWSGSVAGGSGRVSMAGLTCNMPGKRSGMFYAVRE